MFLSFFNKMGIAGTDFAYDEDGDAVECPDCGKPIVFRGPDYYCPECREVIDREDFFDMIDADPPGDECYSCNNNYPCGDCPYGYVDDDDEDDDDY